MCVGEFVDEREWMAREHGCGERGRPSVASE